MKKFSTIASFALVAAFAVAITASAATSMDFGSTTLKKGSTGTSVMNLQSALNSCAGANLTADGKFGKGTMKAVMAFQSSKNLKADGSVGAMTKAALASCGTTTTTTTTGGTTTTTTTSSSSSEGYLTDVNADSTNRVSQVYESQQDKVILGIRATARLADQTIGRVTVTMRNTSTGGSSAALERYISSMSLWNGSTKIGTMAVSDATRSNSDDTYTFQFTGLNSVISKDQIGHLYVSVSANGTIDTNDTSATWTTTIASDGIRATSPDGVYATYGASGGVSTTGLTFGKFSGNGVKATVNLSANSPASSVVAVNNTNNTNAVTLLKFTIQATNSDLTLRKLPIQVVATGHNVSTMINTIKVMQGTQIVDSADGSAGVAVSGGAITSGSCTTTCGFIFSNLSNPVNVIPAGTTVEFSVVADLKSVTAGGYSEGDTLTASFANADALSTSNFSVLASDGNQLSAGGTYRVGSAVGQIQTLRVNGVQVVMGTPTVTSLNRGGTGAGSADVVDVTYSIPLTVTSFGQTLYAGQTAQAAATTSSTNAIAYGFNNATAPSTLTSYSTPVTNITVGGSTLSSSDALIENAGYRLDAGTAKHFTLTVNLNSIGATAGAAKVNLRVALQKFQTFTDNALSTGSAIQSLLPVQSFQSGYAAITAN